MINAVLMTVVYNSAIAHVSYFHDGPPNPKP